MKTFIEILKVQVFGIFSSQTISRKKKSKGILLLGLIFISLIYCSSLYSILIYQGLPSGQKFFMVYILFGAAFLILFIFSITLAQGQLFAFKDFELMMTLPISRKVILISKISSFFILQFIYEIFFIGPVVLIYGIAESMGIAYYAIALVGAIFFALTPITLASMIALLVRKISGTGKYRNMITNAVTIILFVGIFFGSFFFSSNSEAMVGIESLYLILDYLRIFTAPAYYFAQACVNLSVLDLLISISINVLIFIVFVFSFNKLFIQTNSNVTVGYKVKNFKLKEQAVQSQFLTLYIKELRKLFSNFMYMMNMTIGQLMLIGFGIYFTFFEQETIYEVLSIFASIGIDVQNLLFGVIIVAICVFGHLCATASVSISLEGKHLWIIKSSPIRTTDIFLAKILVNVTVIIFTSLLALVFLGIAFKMNLLYIILGCVTIIGLSFFVGLFGLIVNVNYPKLNFDREIVVIKQSVSSFIGIMGGMIISILIACCFYYATKVNVSSLIFVVGLTAFYLIADIGMWIYLKTTGVKKFTELY